MRRRRPHASRAGKCCSAARWCWSSPPSPSASAGRTPSGPLFYRAVAPDGTLALWSAQADGRGLHRLPNSGADSALLGLAPNDHWAVYSGQLDDPLRAGPYLLDLTTSGATSLAQPFRVL